MHGRLVTASRVKLSDGFSAVRAVNFISVTFINFCTLLWVFVVILEVSSSEITVTEGGNITLTCCLNGSNINWTSRGEFLHTGQIFSKQGVTRNESGIYECLDSNNSSELHNVTVQCDHINISCEVDAVPAVCEVIWIFNNRIIQKSNSSRLTYNPANCSLEGKYICFPKNNISNEQNGTTVVQVEGCRSNKSTSSSPGTSDKPTTTPPSSNALLIGVGSFLGILVVFVAVGCYHLLSMLCQFTRRHQAKPKLFLSFKFPFNMLVYACWRH